MGLQTRVENDEKEEMEGEMKKEKIKKEIWKKKE